LQNLLRQHFGPVYNTPGERKSRESFYKASLYTSKWRLSNYSSTLS
jgi:hypothetical protein